MEDDIAARFNPVTTPSLKLTAALSTKSDSQANGLEDEGDNCRICRGEGTTEQPLFYPCKCSGSIRFVHQECLMEWLAHSQKKYCELCKTPFTFTKLYDNSMPSTLPLALFLQQVVIHSIEAFLRNTRYVVVTLVWLCWLPWSIRQVWRGLFWLADGSWVSKARLQEAALTELVSLGEEDVNATVKVLSNAFKTSLQETVSSQMQTSLFSGFVGLFTGDFLLVELVKIIFPSLTRWSQELVSSDAADDPVILLTMDRQPSLLSNVGFISSATNYRLLNGALVDVLEGQLICLIVMVAFILVFLIREWVINQQPIANMPDPDNAAEIVRAGNAQDDVARAARRRRRALRRRADENVHNPEVPRAQMLGARPIVEPRRRMDDQFADLVEDGHVPLDGYNIPVPAAHPNLDTTLLFPQTNDAEASDSNDWVDDEEEAVGARPPLPARGAFDNIADIQRSIEESNLDDPSIPEAEDEVDRTNEVETSLDSSAPETENKAEEVPQMLLPTNPSITVANEHSEAATIDEQIYSYRRHMPNPLMAPHDFKLADTSRMEGPGFEVLEVQDLPPRLYMDNASIAGGSSTDSGAVNSPETPTETSNETSAETLVMAPAKLPILDRIFDWFWHLDDVQRQAVPQTDVHEDDEHVVADAVAEAPFVPNHNREPGQFDQPALEAAPAPVQEPNMLFGVDLNNPDAMEDAEDLDGILELIGMQGPLAGMVQNVIFSEFLITLTIAASVWLPYIWGKIALLIIANPIGVFVRAPLFLASKFADFALDLVIFVAGLLTLAVASSVKALTSLAGGRFVDWHLPELVNTISSNMTKASGTRLEDALSKAFIGLRPDLPTFSLRSHHALRIIEYQLHEGWVSIDGILLRCLRYPIQLKENMLEPISIGQGTVQSFFDAMATLPKQLAAFVLYISSQLRESISILNSSPLQTRPIDLSLARWNAQDKLLAIVLGYLFFACAGYLYLNTARLILGLRSEDKVEGIVADSLRQAGGVVKVVVIIGIEMIVFPLYCGLLLDAALMPLFEGVTLQTRISFMIRAPITGLFVHWFIGTCYMFHFALFVSMCRKIFRKGVLYFIRDPDDPTFHPVRDVLERPVMTQLGKIAFSGFIYGGLVYLCLGGVVYILSCIRGVLPIHWSSNQPQLAFPVDIIFYNFLLPFILRKIKPTKKIAAMYGWWFRGCAHGLRLTNFLFGEERPEEKGSQSYISLWSGLKKGKASASVIKDEVVLDSSDIYDFVRDGGYVRAPATDTVRIPKGHRVFLEVNEKNERVDGEEDKEKGMHGSKDDRFMLVYIPPNFRARMTTFIVLLWLFAATTGVAFTIGPLLIGRAIIQPLASNDVPPNDLYALTIGLHVCGVTLYAMSGYSKAHAWVKDHVTKFRARISFYLYPTAKYLLGLLYLGAATCILPMVFSLLAELYIHVPIYQYLSSDLEPKELPESSTSYFMTLPPTIFLLQTWTVGLVLVRVILHEALGDPETSQPSRAIKAIIRRGYLNPDVKLATRALLLPATILASALWLAPLALGRIINTIFDVADAPQRASIYRYSYPGLAGIVASVYLMLAMRRRIAIWRTKIRDEVYLIGERLHNYQETRESNGKRQKKVRTERVEVG